MNLRSIIISFLALTPLLSAAQLSQSLRKSEAVVVLLNANLRFGANAGSKQTIVIENDTIRAIGRGIDYPKNGMVWDLDGSYVYPAMTMLRTNDSARIEQLELARMGFGQVQVLNDSKQQIQTIDSVLDYEQFIRSESRSGLEIGKDGVDIAGLELMVNDHWFLPYEEVVYLPLDHPVFYSAWTLNNYHDVLFPSRLPQLSADRGKAFSVFFDEVPSSDEWYAYLSTHRKEGMDTEEFVKANTEFLSSYFDAREVREGAYANLIISQFTANETGWRVNHFIDGHDVYLDLYPESRVLSGVYNLLVNDEQLDLVVEREDDDLIGFIGKDRLEMREQGDFISFVWNRSGEEWYFYGQINFEGRIWNGSCLAGAKELEWSTVWQKNQGRVSASRMAVTYDVLPYPNHPFGARELPQREKIIFKDVMVCDGIRPCYRGSVQIADGHIEKVGESMAIPKDYRVIRGSNMYLTAGLIDKIKVDDHAGDLDWGFTSRFLSSSDKRLYEMMRNGVTTIICEPKTVDKPLVAQALSVQWGKCVAAIENSDAGVVYWPSADDRKSFERVYNKRKKMEAHSELSLFVGEGELAGLYDTLDWQASSAFRGGQLTADESLTYLQTYTQNRARLLGLQESGGSIEGGKRADLVLWDGNPFEGNPRTRYVIIDGAIYYDSLSEFDRQESNKELMQSWQLQYRKR